MAHEFLSDDWMDAVEALRDEVPDLPDTAQAATINLVVHDSPFGDREAHLADGRIERGLHADAPTTLRIPYEVAKQLFVANDQQAAMQAFMTGQIKVEGDVTKVMAMSSMTPTPEQLAFQQRIQELTA
ncbi:MAG TPA: SCP2 sterol-binding domain-containing protein [Nocardioidaceae bacterium]|nr:SCP2 sterol-binding domain-containing protein [Nocardioidaceae bacterium]